MNHTALALMRGFIILGVSVAIGLVLYIVADSQFSMRPGQGGFSPGMQLLLSARAAENGGQIAPSFEELGIGGGQMPSGMGSPFDGGGPSQGGFGGGAGGRSFGGGGRFGGGDHETFSPAKAGAQLGQDMWRLGIGAAIAVLLEIAIVTWLKRRSKAAG